MPEIIPNLRNSRSLFAVTGVLILAGLGVGASDVLSCNADDPELVQRSAHAPGSGAIFTTLPDGSAVDHNIYDDKEDVYLDGGPGPQAPIDAAGLPEGDYFFQVTDPSGKELLSTDHISCRKVRVNAEGVISEVYEGTDYRWKGGWEASTCKHETGTDVDHGDDGAVTVQLMPYDDTPNRGGVYKVWMTPVAEYTGDPNFVPTARKDAVNGAGWSAGNAHGFVPAHSKTDNYKVHQKGKPFDPPVLAFRKFHDLNVDGAQNEGEPDITGWEISVTDPVGGGNTVYTPGELMADTGSWWAIEATPETSAMTSAFLDGVQLSAWPSADPLVEVIVEGSSGERHEIVYGNVGLGSVEACKVYDRNADGTPDPDEPKVAGWVFSLEGTNARGEPVPAVQQTTDETGCTAFGDLLPGTYTVTEVTSGGGWTSSGPTSTDVTISSSLEGAVLAGTAATTSFTNYCTATADFGTKGFWHNKNGLTEMSDEDIAYANSLAPYATPSSYFDDGDEPFDGLLDDGETKVPAAKNAAGETVAREGTARAEVSRFLVDANAGGDPREQLAQQLLAFIFNARNRLDAPQAAIELPDGSYTSAAGLIDDAVEAWESGDEDAQRQMAKLLDTLNNADALSYVAYGPCELPTSP